MFILPERRKAALLADSGRKGASAPKRRETSAIIEFVMGGGDARQARDHARQKVTRDESDSFKKLVLQEIAGGARG